MEAKISQRPVLRIDTSGRRAPRPQQELRPPTDAQTIPGVVPVRELRESPPGRHLPVALTKPWQQHSTISLARSNSFADLERSLERHPSRDPLSASTEIDDKLEGKLFLHVYATEIRITEVEAKDGYKSIKTIIRPASTSQSVLSRPSKPSVAPIVNFSLPSTPVSTPKPSRTTGHGALPSPLRTASWRLPSLGLHTRKPGRGRSSQFEEEVDYLQAKLEKEALGGTSAIRIVMEVEQSIHVERQPRQRHRRAQRAPQRRTAGIGR